MRLPVSRNQYDAMLAAKDAEIARLTADRDRWEARYDAMAAQYVDAITPKVPETPTVTPAEPKEQSEIAQAIASEANGDPRIARHFWALARRLKRDGMHTDAIVAEIKWVTPAPVEAA